MTELDFDELDKAVNSLMAESGTPETPAEESVATVASTPPTPAAPVASPAVRRRGQFMDVMHPSANMRTAPALVKGQGVNITPPTIRDAVTPDTEPIPDTTSLSTPETPQAPLIPLEPAGSPIGDGMNLPADMTTTESSIEIIPANADVEPNNPEDSLSSPFLPDAKVEKRPLGTAAPVVESTLGEASDEQPPAAVDPLGPLPVSLEPEKPAEVPEETAPEPVPLPDELKDDVVAVEANEVIHEDMTVDTLAQDVPAAPTPAEASTVGGNIVQQYEEQPSTGDQTNGAIFDTNTYHQPLDAHPAKKKSRALAWVLWIIVLLIVGATAGAAWFYFTTQ